MTLFSFHRWNAKPAAAVYGAATQCTTVYKSFCFLLESILGARGQIKILALALTALNVITNYLAKTASNRKTCTN